MKIGLEMLKVLNHLFDTVLNTSSEIMKRIPDLPLLMDRADYALKLMAEGKLNLAVGTNKNLEVEHMRLKTSEITFLLVFWYCNCIFISILINYDFEK